MNTSPKTLGERLEFALSVYKLSQAQASLLTGVPQATISHLIRNQVRAYKNSRALADGLKINHDWLVYGHGGIFSPTVHYVPVIHEYFRLRLYHSEAFLEDSTHFVVTEQEYGNGMFSTLLDDMLLICSAADPGVSNEREIGFLLWTERRKAIVKDSVQGRRGFLIHETRTYEQLHKDLLPGK